MALRHNCVAMVCGNNDHLILFSQPLPNNVPELCSSLVCAPIKIIIVAGETKHREEGQRRLTRQSDVSVPWVTQGLWHLWAEKQVIQGEAHRTAGAQGPGVASCVMRPAVCHAIPQRGRDLNRPPDLDPSPSRWV